MATTDAVDERREFVRDFEADDDVKAVDWTRDGFRLVIVEYVEITGEDDVPIDRARDLGFDVERVDAATYKFEVGDR